MLLQAAKNLRSMQLDVSIPDGRTIKVNVDSASTASEICDMIAANINIKDSFGFSVHITVNDKVHGRSSLDQLTLCVHGALILGMAVELTR